MGGRLRADKVAKLEEWRSKAYGLGGNLGSLLGQTLDFMTTIVRNKPEDRASLCDKLASFSRQRKASERLDRGSTQQRKIMFGIAEGLQMIGEMLAEERKEAEEKKERQDFRRQHALLKTIKTESPDSSSSGSKEASIEKQSSTEHHSADQSNSSSLAAAYKRDRIALDEKYVKLNRCVYGSEKREKSVVPEDPMTMQVAQVVVRFKYTDAAITEEETLGFYSTLARMDPSETAVKVVAAALPAVMPAAATTTEVAAPAADPAPFTTSAATRPDASGIMSTPETTPETKAVEISTMKPAAPASVPSTIPAAPAAALGTFTSAPTIMATTVTTSASKFPQAVLEKYALAMAGAIESLASSTSVASAPTVVTPVTPKVASAERNTSAASTPGQLLASAAVTGTNAKTLPVPFLNPAVTAAPSPLAPMKPATSPAKLAAAHALMDLAAAAPAAVPKTPALLLPGLFPNLPTHAPAAKAAPAAPTSSIKMESYPVLSGLLNAPGATQRESRRRKLDDIGSDDDDYASRGSKRVKTEPTPAPPPIANRRPLCGKEANIMKQFEDAGLSDDDYASRGSKRVKTEPSLAPCPTANRRPMSAKEANIMKQFEDAGLSDDEPCELEKYRSQKGEIRADQRGSKP